MSKKEFSDAWDYAQSTRVLLSVYGYIKGQYITATRGAQFEIKQQSGVISADKVKTLHVFITDKELDSEDNKTDVLVVANYKSGSDDDYRDGYFYSVEGVILDEKSADYFLRRFTAQQRYEFEEYGAKRGSLYANVLAELRGEAQPRYNARRLRLSE